MPLAVSGPSVTSVSSPPPRLHRRRRAGRRGFTLIELIVVVVIISALAVLAIPSITNRMRDRRTMQTAHEIASVYRDARMRAMGRGSAVLVRFASGAFEIREAVRGTAETAGCQALPVSSCLATNWGDAAGYREVRRFVPGQGAAGDQKLELVQPNGNTTAEMDVCFTPTGRSFARYALAQPLAVMAGVPLARVWRQGSDGAANGLERRVLILPNGNARLGTSGARQ